MTPLFTFFANKAKTSNYLRNYGKGGTNATNDSVKMKQFTSNSDTIIGRSESEENILAPEGKDYRITKTTEIRVQQCADDNDVNKKEW